MKVILTIAVRNPDWYWTKEEMDNAGDYRNEWEALNEDIVWKHVPSDTFEIPFDVKDIKENRKAELYRPLNSWTNVALNLRQNWFFFCFIGLGYYGFFSEELFG